MLNKGFKSIFHKKAHKILSILAAMCLMVASFSGLKSTATTTQVGNDQLVLKMAAGTAWKWFGQQVELEAGKEYAFSYYYSPNDNASPRLYKNLEEGEFEPTKITEDGDSYKRTVTFTVPDDAVDSANGKKLIWVGFRSGEALLEDVFYYQFNLYDTKNPTINLFNDPNWSENGSSINKDIWISAWGDQISYTFSKVTLEEIGGMDAFKKADSSNFALKMDAGPSWVWFGQQVELAAGKEYAFSYYYSQNDNSSPCLYKNLEEGEFEPTRIIKDEEYCKITVIFTPPADAVDGNNGKKLIWVGFRTGEATPDSRNFYNIKLSSSDDSEVNLLKDSLTMKNWITAWGSNVSSAFSWVSLESIGGIDSFKRQEKINVDPKMMYYERTNRGPNQEPYGCFTMSFPSNVNKTGKNYILQFDARSQKGIALDNFRMYSLDPQLAADEDFTVNPVKIDGYTYTFNLRQDINAEGPFSFMIFVPEGSTGHISNLNMYEADSNFVKVNDINLLQNKYGDFSLFEQLGDKVEMYAMQGACIGTQTGRLDAMPEFYFEPSPDVAIPAGPKMMSYSTCWGSGLMSMALPHSVESGSASGKNYVVSFYLRPTKGRDAAKYYTSGVDGELIQIYPVDIDGYKYTFNIKERYNFRLALEFPNNCEGYISNLEMYEADENFKIVNNQNKSTVFGKDGNFSDIDMQPGMCWSGLEFTGGFTNTFIDTRVLEQELKDGVIGEYHCSGGLWPIPNGYLQAAKDEGWADDYETSGSSEKGTITGKLVDNNGNGIESVVVCVVSMQDPNLALNSTTDKNGNFKFDNVALGGYEIYVTQESGEVIVGEEFVWVESDGDIVNVSLTYEGSRLAVSVSTSDMGINYIIVFLLLTVSSAAILVTIKKRKQRTSK